MLGFCLTPPNNALTTIPELAKSAFGIHPERTLLLALGAVRQFTDIIGRHIVFLPDTPESRQTVADRLTTAGCEVVTSGKTAWMREGKFQEAAYPHPDSSGPSPSLKLHDLLNVHPVTLDPPVLKPLTNGAIYTAKLRISFQNKSALPIKILPPSWLTSHHTISVQSGASPYPDVPYMQGGAGFGYRYQSEGALGSWKHGKWKMTSEGKDDEVLEIDVPPQWTFRLWIGLNPCVPHIELEQRKNTHRLGTLILPVLASGEQQEWKLDL